MQRLHPEGAQQRFPVPQPAQGGAGVSVDGTVQHGGASEGNSLGGVSFSLQHWRLCRHIQSDVTTKAIVYVLKQSWNGLMEYIHGLNHLHNLRRHLTNTQSHPLQHYIFCIDTMLNWPRFLLSG